MNKRIIAGLAALLIAVAGYAWAQSLPQVTNVSTFADRIQVLPNGQSSAQSVFAQPAQITTVFGYYKSAPATGFTYTFPNNVAYAAFAPSGTIAAGYVTLSATPSDGTRECVFSTAQITALYIAANTSQSINNAINGGTLSANTGACYIYGQSNATWDRS